MGSPPPSSSSLVSNQVLLTPTASVFFHHLLPGLLELLLTALPAFHFSAQLPVFYPDRSVAGLDRSGWLSFGLGIKSRLLLKVTYEIFYDLASACSLIFPASYLAAATPHFSPFLPGFPTPLPSFYLAQSCSCSSLCVHLILSLPEEPPHVPCLPHHILPVPCPPEPGAHPLWHTLTVLSSAWLGRFPTRT